jgi:predicted TIM-barrel fold metal-dependent hydrolase
MTDTWFVCERLPAGRVLYGSDYPHVAVGESLELAHELAPRTEPTRAEVFGQAAKRLYRLPLD